MKHIVKRAGHTETYDERKVYASVYSSVLALRETPQVAEMLAEKVSHLVNDWIESKLEVTSHDIRRVAAKELEHFHQDAAWIYKHHRNIS